MDSSLKTLLGNRRREIEEQISRLRRELIDIDRAELALAQVTGKLEIKSQKRVASNPLVGSIKYWILQSLFDHHSGLPTASIASEIVRLGGPYYKISSISPQLSRLKSGGHITYDGRRWMLPEFAEEASGAETEKPPSQGEEGFGR